MSRRRILAGLLGAALASAVPARVTAEVIILQAGTTLQASGLLDFLLPRFTAASGIEVRVVAVGTGQALANARRGDGDVVLVHDPVAEAAFVAAGHGRARIEVMYNDFVLVGPASDPAGVRAADSVTTALASIAAQGARFISRDDDSGTHRKERSLWRSADIDVEPASGAWYLETGAGMAATLNTASAMDAYTLTDRATWLAFRNKRGLEILLAGDPRLGNRYSVIAVDPARHPRVAAAAQRFIDWLTGVEGQRLIAEYRVAGERAFRPGSPSEAAGAAGGPMAPGGR